MSGYIYIMRAGPYFKIGYTESWPTGRLQQIQISNPEPVYLIGVTAGTMQEEKRLHETYAAKRSHGEWFALSNHDVNTILVRGVRIPIQPPRPGRRVYAPPRRRTSPPETMREDVLSLLAAGRGMSSSQAAAALGVSKTTAYEHLTALRDAGVVELTGAGPSSRFVLTTTDHRRAIDSLRGRLARLSSAD